jgi:hypothetical protein
MKFVYVILVTTLLFGCDSKPKELTMAEKCANVGMREFLRGYPSNLGLELHSYSISEEKYVGGSSKPSGLTVFYEIDFTFNGQRMQQRLSKYCDINYGY